ncbi:MAG: MFS transporter [Chloroflexi bacterium]|nr:MFS transporter [Chloroflexota bacterium]
MKSFILDIWSMLKNRNVFIVSFTFFLVITGVFSWFPVLPLRLRELGANDVQVGLTYAFLGLAFTLFQVIGGLMSDRWGRKKIIVWPTYTFIIFYTLCGFAGDWKTLTLWMVIADSFSALQMPSFSAITAESVPEEKRGSAFGVIWFGLALGMTTGSALGALLLKYFSFNVLFYITAVIFAVCAVLRHVYLKETHMERATFSLKGLTGSISKAYLLFIGAGILFAITFNLTHWGPFVTLFASDIQKYNMMEIQMLFMVSGISAIVSSLIAGRLVDRFGALRLMGGGVIFHCIIVIIWTFFHAFWISVICFSLFRFCFQVAFISYEALLNKLCPQGQRGTLVGIAGSLNGALGASGPVIGSSLKVSYGPAAPFYGALGFAVASAVMVALVSRESQEKKEPVV